MCEWKIFLVTSFCWLLTALSCQCPWIIKSGFFIIIPHPQALQKWKELSFDLASSSAVGENSVYSPIRISNRPLQQENILCYSIFRSHPVSSSSDPFIRLSPGRESCTPGQCCCHCGFSFPMLPSLLWQKDRIRTLFCTSFRNGSSKWGGPCCCWAHFIARCFLSLSQVTQAGLGENPWAGNFQSLRLLTGKMGCNPYLTEPLWGLPWNAVCKILRA